MTAILRAAVVTPPGAAAIATLAIVGADAWTMIRSAIRVPSLPPRIDSTRPWISRIGQPPGDTVVVSVRRNDPVPWIEIHCHGGKQIVQWIINDLVSRGAAWVDWRELSAGFAASPLRAAAEFELTRAVTSRTAAILLDQVQGALDKELAEMVSELKIESVHQRLAELLRFADLGRHLTRPWRVVVAGLPNVGKSSLINRLVGYPRCVVTPIAGATRDLVATSIAIDGWPVELIDTAGQRTSSEPLEATGIALASEIEQSADLVLWLFDDDAAPMPQIANRLIVRNKIDVSRYRAMNADVIPVSALTGDGLDGLLANISGHLVPHVPRAGAPVPFNARFVEHLAEAANQLSAGNVIACKAEIESLVSGEQPS